jgi:glutamyl-tRNA synthetase
MDMKGRKLSKRDGDVDVHAFRLAGYLPETLLNFIALLGWNPGSDRERFTLDELTQEFSVARLGQSNARFARDKLLAFNTEAIAKASPERLLEALKDYLSLHETPLPRDDDVLRHLLSACKGIRTFADLTFKSSVLFGPDDAYEFDPKAVKQALDKAEGAGYAMLHDFREVLETCPWTLTELEKATSEFCEAKGVGLKKVAMPLRVAVTGTQISPPIFDTLVFLGREKTLARIDRCVAGR